MFELPILYYASAIFISGISFIPLIFCMLLFQVRSTKSSFVTLIRYFLLVILKPKLKSKHSVSRRIRIVLFLQDFEFRLRPQYFLQCNACIKVLNSPFHLYPQPIHLLVLQLADFNICLQLTFVPPLIIGVPFEKSILIVELTLPFELYGNTLTSIPSCSTIIGHDLP